MDSRSRLVLFGFVVLIVAFAVMAILAATEALPERWLELQAQELADATGGVKAIVIIVSVGIALCMLALLKVELTVKDHRLQVTVPDGGIEQGKTTIGSRSVEALAENAGKEIHGVKRVHCNVTNGTDGIVVSCHSTVAMGSNLPSLCDETRHKIKASVEELTGLSVSRVDVDARYDSATTKRLGVH